MFKTALLNPPVNGYARLAIDVQDDGVYLLLSRSKEAGTYEFDHWFETLSEAEEAALEGFGIAVTDWIPAPH